MKSAIIALILSIPTLGVAQNKPSPDVIKIEFSKNGVSKPCGNTVVELHMGARLVPVQRIEGGFIVPPLFGKLYRSPQTRRRNNISVHVNCGEYAFDFPNEYPGRLLPGAWKLGVSYPDSWFDRSVLESRSSAVGRWLTFIDWECDICEPVSTEMQAHFDIPDDVSARLKQAQPQAVGERAMAIAFALAVFGVDQQRNRNYLLDLLSTCLASPSKPAIEGICDDTRLASMIANLYVRGDGSLLRPLLEAAESPAYVAEELGYFYADSLDRHQPEFLRGLAELPPDNQMKVCRMAQNDSFSMDGPLKERVVKQLRANGGETALRCLQVIETARD